MVMLTIQAEKSSQGQVVVSTRLDDRVVARDRVDLSSAADRNRYAEDVRRGAPAVSVEDVNRKLTEIDPSDLPSPPPSPDDPWPTPTPLETVDLPAFPVGALPEPLRSMVAETAEATQTPPDLAGLLALAACSGMVARTMEIEPLPGWCEPINLYAACLLEPANRKSAVFKTAFAPVEAIEKALRKKSGPEIARLSAERRCKEAELKKCESRAGSGDKDFERARQRAIELAEELCLTPVPALPRLLAADATSEAVESLLHDQGGRLIVASAEGGIFDVMAGRYTGGASNLDVFLQGHAGDDLRTDRIGRGSVMVERSCLTLALAVQPDVIGGLAGKPAFRGRGLIGRFVYALPKSLLGKRRATPGPVPAATLEAYAKLIERLFDLSEDAAIQKPPPRLKLAADATSAFVQWFDEVEAMLAEGGRLGAMGDWGGKLCGLTARFAAILHLAGNNRPEPWLDAVSEQTVQAAIALARWAIPHAEATFRLMSGRSGALGDAAYVLKRLRDLGHSAVTRREIQNLGRSRFDQEPDRLSEALQELVDRDWIRPSTSTERTGPGRKPSQRFFCHPSLVSENQPVLQEMTESSLPLTGARKKVTV